MTLNFISLPGEQTEYLRRETGNSNLEFVWLPDETRLNRLFRFNSRDRGKGCFGICNWVRQRVDSEIDGVKHTRSELIPYVTVLDGNHDKPFYPGRWCIDMLLEADTATRGVERKREVDDWREAKVVKDIRVRDTMAHDYANDQLLYNAMKRYAEDVGTEMPTREEMVKLEGNAIRRAEELDQADQRARRESRMNFGKSAEELL